MKCNVCGIHAPTEPVVFKQNVGMIIMRNSSIVEGFLCKTCISRTFWSTSVKTLIFGWWGFISFFVTPVYLINNLSYYISSLKMQKPPELTEAKIVKLEMHKKDIVQALSNEKDIDEIAEDLSKRTGVTMYEALFYVQLVSDDLI